jgi:hypothetical protein
MMASQVQRLAMDTPGNSRAIDTYADLLFKAVSTRKTSLIQAKTHQIHKEERITSKKDEKTQKLPSPFLEHIHPFSST